MTGPLPQPAWMTPPPGIEVLTPRDRAAWLRARGRDVTASTVGALFGVHEFTTLFELFAIKTGRLPRDAEETPAMRRGRHLEVVAVNILREERPGWTVVHNAAANTYYRDPHARLGATPDLLVHAPERGFGIVQVKSVEASTFRRKWLDAEGDPEPPLWIALQAVLEARLTGASWAAVAALVVGHGIDLHMVEVPLDHADGVYAEMAERSADFWRMVEEGREPDPDFGRDGDVIDRIYAIGDGREEADLTGDPDILGLIGHVATARDDMARAEAARVRYEAEIKAAMGTAEVAHIPGGRRITWRTYARRDPTTGRLTHYRVLRLPKIDT